METKDLVFFPQYHYTVHFIFTDDIAASRKEYDKIIGHPMKGNNEFTDGVHSYNEDQPEAYIFLKSDGCYSTLAHECLHGAYRMFRWIGAEDVDEEIMAYTLGYLVERAGSTWERHLEKIDLEKSN